MHPLYGFHPTITTSFHGIGLEPSCYLYLLLTLPPLVFVDPYELANYKDSYTFHHAGPSNLELPVSAIGPDNSHVLVNVSHKAVTEGALQIPLHLRYGQVSASMDGFHAVDVSMPEGYVICEGRAGSDAESYMPEDFAALFRRSNISHLLPSETVFYVQVPVGRLGDISQVEMGTTFTILLCFAYLIYTSYKTAVRLGNTEHLKSS
ncbi:uncharacterized protein BT62DRAFT_927143 [Guyanagaster necrorhizus]|uniref:Protein PBN1 n=1 Tax=Guyanagaster necrorhizus TaxID=856835 RepID=A0A9P7W3E3_9AGAR|nr:uncharacterized protein BT62DRAFT_927143 [Guyanagaster necrorhizus MCA 3950]KAG7451437.1 hypothetical protein BT62DRAFT_927143 [Guyanagaster necrorhizus MCA 3950]